MAVDLKSIEVQASGGSNPPFSARYSIESPLIAGFLLSLPVFKIYLIIAVICSGKSQKHTYIIDIVSK